MPVLLWAASPKRVHSRCRGMGQGAVLAVHECLSHWGFCQEAVLPCAALFGRGGE